MKKTPNPPDIDKMASALCANIRALTEPARNPVAHSFDLVQVQLTSRLVGIFSSFNSKTTSGPRMDAFLALMAD